MKIPLYSAQGTVGLRQEQRGALRSPEDAARLQIAKFGALAAGAEAIGDITGALAEVKAKEEVASSTATYNAAMASLDKAFDDLPTQFDENGIPTYDADEVMAQRQEAYRKLESDILTNMKSPMAKSAFTSMILEDRPERKKADAIKAFGHETEALLEKSEWTLETLMDAENFDGAEQYVRDNIDVFGVDKFTEKMAEIGKRRTTQGVWTVLNTPPLLVDRNDINAQLDILQDPAFVTMDGDEKNVLIGRLSTQLDTLDKTVEDNQDEYYRQIYTEMLPRAVGGQLPLSELIQSGLPVDNALFKDLLKRVDGGDTEGDSDPGMLRGFENRVRQLSSRSGVLDNWGEAVELLIDEMQDPSSGLNYTDSQKLADELRGDIDKIYGTTRYQNLNRQTYQIVAGYEPGMFDNMEAMYSSQFKTANLTALKFQEALAVKAKLLGPRRDDELGDWVDLQAPIWKARLNNDLFKSVGVSIDWDSSTTTFDAEMLKDVQTQMYNHLNKYPADLSKAEGVIAEMQRLNDIQLLPVVRKTP